MIAVGIDVASKKHDYFMIQSETGLTFKRSSVTIENNESGYKKPVSEAFQSVLKPATFFSNS